MSAHQSKAVVERRGR